jgi:hypothetical protein
MKSPADKLYGHPRFYELLEQMADTHSRKNHDYAEESNPLSNFEEVSEHVGIKPFDVIRVFLATKNARLKQLSKKENLVVGESIKDTLMDMAVYALLGYIMLEESEQPQQ